MAKEQEKTEEIEKIDQTEQKEKKEQTEEAAPKAKSSFNLKIILFGLPIFIIQLVVVYFITANFIIGETGNANAIKTAAKDSSKKEIKKGRQEIFNPGGELGKFIFPIDDIIVNPSGTDGKRLLLVSLGFDVTSEENKTELKSSEVLLRDVVISTLSSKTLVQLDNISYRDSLKYQIAVEVKHKIPSIELNDIYFSKYIIQ